MVHAGASRSTAATAHARAVDHRARRAACARLGWSLAMLALAIPAAFASDVAFSPSTERARNLVRLVRQDCGACHGLQLTGGLGPALTPAALREWSADNLAATILHGRAGTPMPPWSRFVSADEAGWIARRLLEGFPQEAASAR
jgi:cytochrome c55X